MIKKNILLIASEIFYPVSSGGALALYEKVKILSEEFNIYLLALDVDGLKNYEEFKNELSKYVYDLKIVRKKNLECTFIEKLTFNLRTIFSLKPRFYHFVSEIDDEIKKYINNSNIDYLIFELLPSTLFLKFIDNKDYIYFAHNAEAYLLKNKAELESNFIKKIYFYIESLRISFYEKSVVKNSKKTFFFTEKDLQKVCINNSHCEVIPPIIMPKELNSEIITSNECLIPTNLKHEPNYHSIIWFFEKIFPSIKKDVKINITGYDRNDILKYYDNKFKNVTYHGVLDSYKYQILYEKCEIVINPTISGSGVQMKMLEALSYNKIVISTNFSNFLNINTFSTDNPIEFAQFINDSYFSKINPSFMYEDYYFTNKNILFKHIRACR